MIEARSSSTESISNPQSWLDETRLDTRGYHHWWVDVEISADGIGSALHLSLRPAEWGMRLQHGGAVSALIFTDASCDVGRDDLDILDAVSELSRPTDLFELLASRFALTLRMHTAIVRSNVPDAPRVLRAWLLSV